MIDPPPTFCQPWPLSDVLCHRGRARGQRGGCWSKCRRLREQSTSTTARRHSALLFSLKEVGSRRVLSAISAIGSHVQEEQQGKKQEEAPRVAGAGGKGGGAAGEEEGEGKLAEVKAHHSFAWLRTPQLTRCPPVAWPFACSLGRLHACAATFPQRVAVGVKKKVGKYERRKIFKLKKNRDGTPMFSGMEAEDSD